jgi:hypothetical protein
VILWLQAHHLLMQACTSFAEIALTRTRQIISQSSMSTRMYTYICQNHQSASSQDRCGHDGSSSPSISCAQGECLLMPRCCNCNDSNQHTHAVDGHQPTQARDLRLLALRLTSRKVSSACSRALCNSTFMDMKNAAP